MNSKSQSTIGEISSTTTSSTRHKNDDEVVVIEKRFGYDRLGIIISGLLIGFLIILICIPSLLEYLGDDEFKQINNIVLVTLIVVLILVGFGILYFINFQQKQAKKQRLNSTYGIYTLERQRSRRNQQQKVRDENMRNGNMIELQSLKLDLNSNEKKKQHKIHHHHHHHVPADNSKKSMLLP